MIVRVHETGNTFTNSGAPIAIPATTKGNLLVVMFCAVGEATLPISAISSITDTAGDVFIPASRATNDNVPGLYNAVEIWYAYITGSSSSVTITDTTGIAFDSCIIEYSPSAGKQLLFNSAQPASNQSTSDSILVGPITNASAGNNLMVAVATSSITSYASNVAQGGYTYNLFDNTDGEGFSDLLNVPSGSYTPAWLADGDTTDPCSVNVAFSDTVPVYSVPDCRNYGNFPNNSANVQGTLTYTVPTVDSRLAGPPIDSRTSGLVEDCRIAPNIPENSRTFPPFE